MIVKSPIRLLFLLPVLILVPCLLSAQPILKPHIGVRGLPNDVDAVCGYPIPSSPDMTFDSYPFFSGDTITDFTLYDLNGDSMNIATLLSNGKPVLIVALNYTCPYVRNKVSIYNDILANYSSFVDIIGIYQLEAHPDDDYSPNSGAYGNVQSNVNAGIVIDQHKTYLDRKSAAQDLITNTGLNIPVYMDDPCNSWWENFGPGPATGYIINANGTVFVKHGWFDKYANGHEIYCDIDSLYGTTCTGTTPDGDFGFTLTTNDTVYGLPGTTIDVEADFTNNSGADALIEIERDQNNMANGWESAICADVCLNAETDLYTFLLRDGETQHFWMHFYADDLVEGASSTKMRFTNVNDFSNQFIFDFYAFSDFSFVGINNEPENKEQINLLNIYPNPFSSSTTIHTLNQESISSIEIYNLSGQLIREDAMLSGIKIVLEREHLSAGMYFVKVLGEKGIIGRQKIIIQR